MDLENSQKLATAIEEATGWNVSGITNEVLRQVREQAVENEREPSEEWQDTGADLLRNEVYFSVMSRDPENVPIVMDAVRKYVSALIELM